MKILSRRSSYPYFHKQGSVLIIVIWAMVFFAILGVSMYSIVSAYAALSQRIEDNLLGLYLAKAAYIDALSQMKGGTSPDKPPIWSGIKIEKELGKGKYICTISGENSKININSASIDVLARLTGMDKTEVLKITGSTLKPFRVKEELLMIEGVTDEMYNNIKDYITIYGDGAVNINTAPDKVLESLGMDSELINTINEFKAGPDGQAGTEDDQVFKSTGDIISSMTWLSEEEKTLLLNLTSGGTLSADSRIFLLDIKTEIVGRPANKYQIVTDGEKVLRWTE